MVASLASWKNITRHTGFFDSMCPSAARSAKHSRSVSEVQLLNVNEIRKDFPILKTGVVYLDSTASSLTPEPVLQRMLEFYREYRANVERGVHRLSVRASDEYENAGSAPSVYKITVGADTATLVLAVIAAAVVPVALLIWGILTVTARRRQYKP